MIQPEKKHAALAAALVGTLALAAGSAEAEAEAEAKTPVPVVQAGEAVVSAGDVKVTANEQEELLRQAPETKTVITQEEIRRKGARTLSDALAAEQDIQMGMDNMGRKTVAIRGAEARHTLLLVDGRRLAGGLSKFYGATDEVNRLSVDNIDHIEIIRGAGTARYGADAIGGVINIVTKVPHTAGGKITMERSWIGAGGSQYNHNIYYATGKIGKGLYMDFSYGREKTAPFLYDADGSSMQYYGKRTPMRGRFEVTLGKGESLLFSADRLEEDLQKDTPLGTMFAMRAKEDAWRTNYSLAWKKQTAMADYALRVYTSKYHSDTDFHVNALPSLGRNIWWPYFDFFTREDRVVEGSAGLALSDSHYLTFGADYREERGEGTRIEVPGETGRDLTRVYARQNPADPTIEQKLSASGFVYDAGLSSYSGYLMDSWQAGKKWLFVPALRYTNHSRFGANLSPSLGATYTARKNLRFKANIGTSFATPGIAELYHNWEMYEPSLNQRPPFRNGWLFEGNPDLKPEKALNMDLSVESELNPKTSVKFTLFRNDFKDYMQVAYIGERESKHLNGFTHYDYFTRYPASDPWMGTSYTADEVISDLEHAADWDEKDEILYEKTDYVKGVPAMDDVYTYKNIAKARTQGAEAELTHQLSRDLTLKLGYTYLDARDRETHRRLEGRARHMLNVTLGYSDKKHGWRATLWGDYAKNYLDIRDRVATGRIIRQDGTATADHYTLPGEGTDEGKTYHIFATEEEAEKYMKGDIEHGFTREKVAREKNYGLWNLMVEKDLSDASTVYAGITNLFNQYDPYLGMGGRIYRLGLRMRF